MISIIVPVYKAEKYISRCIDSVLSQTYKDWELLLVDDGSPDNSGKICDEYAQKDSRIRVFHKPNGGVSSARNLGLDNAKGEWITFLDADDYLQPTFLERLINNADADLVISGSQRFGNSSDDYKIPEDRVYDIQRFAEKWLNHTAEEEVYLCCVGYPWGKIFKRSLIEAQALRFNTKLKLSEDLCFVLQYLSSIESVKFIRGGDYMYFVSEGEKAHHCMSFEEYKNHVESMHQTITRFGVKFNLDTYDTFCLLCNMYFNALLKFMSTSTIKDMSKTLSSFRLFNKINLGKLMQSISTKKRFILKIAMNNSLLLYGAIRMLARYEGWMAEIRKVRTRI